jgi:hypothetical protein
MKLSAFGAALALALLVFAALPAAAKTLALSADIAGNDKALWKAVMTGLYGPYDGKRKCWVGKAESGPACMRPHRLQRISTDDGEQLFLAIGSVPEEGGDCHACSGYMGLVLFAEQDGGSYQLAAQNSLYEDFGSFGVIPAEESFSVEQIGPDTYAWVIESGYTGQGVTSMGKAIYAARDGKIVNIGYIPYFLDDCDTGNQPCPTYEFGVSFQQDTGDTYYDVLLDLAEGSTVPDAGKRFEIPFDAGAGQYKVPEALSSLMSM